MDSNTKLVLQQLVQDAVANGVKEAVADHTCKLDSAVVLNIGHLFGMIRDIGGGGEHGYSRGIEKIRKVVEFDTPIPDREENHRFMGHVRGGVRHMRIVSLGVLAVGALTGIGAAILFYVRFMLSQGK